jgi:hypothetical protein
VKDISDVGLDDIDLDTKVCDLMVTGRKSKLKSRKNNKERKKGKKSTHLISP